MSVKTYEHGTQHSRIYISECEVFASNILWFYWEAWMTKQWITADVQSKMSTGCAWSSNITKFALSYNGSGRLVTQASCKHIIVGVMLESNILWTSAGTDRCLMCTSCWILTVSAACVKMMFSCSMSRAIYCQCHHVITCDSCVSGTLNHHPAGKIMPQNVGISGPLLICCCVPFVWATFGPLLRIVYSGEGENSSTCLVTVLVYLTSTEILGIFVCKR